MPPDQLHAAPPHHSSSPPPYPARPLCTPAQAQPPVLPCFLVAPAAPAPPRLAPRQRHTSPSSYHGPSSASPHAPFTSSPQLRLAPRAAPAADRPAPQHQPPPSARLAPAQLTSTASLLTPEIASLKPAKAGLHPPSSVDTILTHFYTIIPLLTSICLFDIKSGIILTQILTTFVSPFCPKFSGINLCVRVSVFACLVRAN
jgi:hypothetical protein